jgi:hypothetical protein
MNETQLEGGNESFEKVCLHKSLLKIIPFFQRPNATMPYKPGFEEDGFLKSLAPFEPKEIELKAKNCTEVSIIIIVT